MTIAIMPTNIALSIMAVGLIYAIFAIVVQRTLTNPRKMREIQRRSQELSKKMNQLVKSNAPKEEIDAVQKELMPLLSETMKKQFVPMLVVLPTFLIMYYLILPAVFASVTSSYFVFQLLGSQQQLGWRGLFIYTAFILGFVASMVVLVYDRRKMAQEAAPATPQSTANPPSPANQNIPK